MLSFVSKGKEMIIENMKNKYTNALINSLSPYLLQHAHNPVNWQPWSDELIKNRDNNGRLLLVSIGYAACHWCHVMERESFEDEEVASVMNRYFVNIKVDREERPDVDNYYMTAVHLMGLHGGWPLNVIALPDGRPIWGGTYFPKETWINTITSVARFWKENPEKTREYAGSLQNGIARAMLPVETDNVIPATAQIVKNSVEKWKNKFDLVDGGQKGAPKFPMPANIDFLLNYGILKSDNHILDFVKLTLEKIVRGGIYDQIGGGFARYSVDEKWKVPHFEKMLYDNSQLISTYSKAYQHFKSEEFKTAVDETVSFIECELMDSGAAFYSSLDADSDGVEGKFYVWRKDELKELLKDDFDLFFRYFNVNSKGLWEDGNYILLRTLSLNEFAENNGYTAGEFAKKVVGWKKKLFEYRLVRNRPSLDDKTIISWNALVIKGLADAYKAFGQEKYKELALKNGRFIDEIISENSGRLIHTWKKGEGTVNGFLEDYAMVIKAFLSLYEITGDEGWFNSAEKLTEYTISRFYDKPHGLFYFSETDANNVFPGHFQTEDNVLPSANSVMADNLFNFYHLYGKPEYLTMVKKMLHHVTPNFTKYPQAFANWGNLMLKLTEPFFEVVVCGIEAPKKYLDMQNHYLPNVLWSFSTEESKMQLFESRYIQGKTLIYVCRNGACNLPVEDINEAMEMIGLNKV